MFKSILLSVALLAVADSMVKAQSYPLSEVEITLVRQGHGGCYGPCTHYAVTIGGDGAVNYSGTAGFGPKRPTVEGPRTRRISPDDVVSLVNEFLQARFFDALPIYRNKTFIIREGDNVKFLGSGGSDDPQADLTLRIGDRKKTVTLFNNYPPDLGRLPELVDRIGGPEIWLTK